MNTPNISTAGKILCVIFALVVAIFASAPVWAAPSRAAKGLDVAIVVDDSASTGLGSQFRDVAKFIRSLPANAQVEVVYAANGVARVEQGFTSEHEAAAKSLRLPMGTAAGASGLYDALRDVAKHWPDDGAARVVILISQGLDLSYGASETSPYQNIGLQRVVETFQHAGITTYALYASDAGRAGLRPSLVANGQGCLLRLSEETGGEAYLQGFRTAIDFGVFLDQVRERLPS